MTGSSSGEDLGMRGPTAQPIKRLIPRELYANLMDEAKARIETIDFVLNRSGMPQMFAQEIGYLQLRMLCEIVALGCLIAHGDITRIDLKQLEREYLADRIIKRMTALHANFYPRPVTISRSPAAKAPHHAFQDALAVGF